MFTDSIKKITLSFDSLITDRETVDTQLGYQADIGSARNNNSPKYLIVACQKIDRIGASNKAENVANFENFNVRK